MNIKKYRKIIAEGGWVLFGQFFSVMGALAGVKVFTEFLDPAQYGRLSLGMTIITLVNLLFIGPLSQAVQRYYSKAIDNNLKKSFFDSVKKLSLQITGLIALLGIIIVGVFWIWGDNEWVLLIIAAFLFVIVDSYNTIFIALLTAARKRKILSIFSTIYIWLRFLIAVLFIRIFYNSPQAAMFGYCVASVIMLAPLYIYCNRELADSDNYEGNSNFNSAILKYSLPFTIWGVFYFAQSASDKWAINYFMSTHEVGEYSVLYQLGFYPIAMVSGFILSLLTPIIFQKAGNGSNPIKIKNANSIVWKLTISAIILTIFGSIAGIFLHRIIFNLFVAEKYLEVSYLLPLILINGGLFSAGQTLSLVFLTNLQPDKMLILKIVTAIIGLCLNIAGAYIGGLIGVVIAGITFSLIYLLWMVILSNKQRNKLLNAR